MGLNLRYFGAHFFQKVINQRVQYDEGPVVTVTGRHAEVPPIRILLVAAYPIQTTPEPA